MDNLDQLIKTTASELSQMARSASVFGTPIHLEGSTIIPLVKVHIGFAAGAGTGGSKKESGDGSGGGVDVQPVAVLIVDEEGVRLESAAAKPENKVGLVINGLKTILKRRKAPAPNRPSGESEQ